MIIHEPELQRQRGRVRVVVPIAFETPGLCLPDRLWMEFPEEYEPSTRADGFAAAMLPVAMTLGEALEIRGAVCPDLAYGLDQYQETVRDYHPRVFRRVNVRYRQLGRAVIPSGERMVCQTFSGGVDSFYTLRQHVAGGALHPLLPVTHALFVHGFDVAVSDCAAFESMTAVYEPGLRNLGVQLLTVRTNLRELTREVNWEISHGTALACVAHVLGPPVRNLLVAATYKYSEPVLWGSDPRLDHWLSSASMGVIHYGAHLARMEKLIAMADWEPVRESLRVCWIKSDGVLNCCRCIKCLITMVGLQLVGDLKDFRTFPLPYDGKLARQIRYEGASLFAGRIALRLARQHGKKQLARDIEYGLRRTRQTR